MSALSWIALVFGVLGVWLTIRQTIYCWPVSLVAVVASIAEFYYQRLYGDMSLQIFYFFAGIYGWVYWNSHASAEFKVARMELTFLPVMLLLTVLQALLYYFIISYFNGDRPVLDSILTASSLTATYMMTRKWIENWIAWVVIDGAYVILYGLKEMWLFGILYLLFAVMAYYGYLKWKTSLRSAS